MTPVRTSELIIDPSFKVVAVVISLKIQYHWGSQNLTKKNVICISTRKKQQQQQSPMHTHTIMCLCNAFYVRYVLVCVITDIMSVYNVCLEDLTVFNVKYFHV